MISHDNIIFGAATVFSKVPELGSNAAEEERVLSFLPLSHVAGMMVDIVAPLYQTATAKSHMEVWFARVYDLKVGRLFREREIERAS
jgi:long-subunit acyl-CoA synthetase (AMP-forming)